MRFFTVNCYSTNSVVKIVKILILKQIFVCISIRNLQSLVGSLTLLFISLVLHIFYVAQKRYNLLGLLDELRYFTAYFCNSKLQQEGVQLESVILSPVLSFRQHAFYRFSFSSKTVQKITIFKLYQTFLGLFQCSTVGVLPALITDFKVFLTGCISGLNIKYGRTSPIFSQSP